MVADKKSGISFTFNNLGWFITSGIVRRDFSMNMLKNSAAFVCSSSYKVSI